MGESGLGSVHHDFQIPGENEVAILVQQMHAPPLNHAGTQREGVNERERIRMPAPSRVVHLAHAPAVIHMRSRIAKRYPRRQRLETLPLRCHGRGIPEAGDGGICLS